MQQCGRVFPALPMSLQWYIVNETVRYHIGICTVHNVGKGLCCQTPSREWQKRSAFYIFCQSGTSSGTYYKISPSWAEKKYFFLSVSFEQNMRSHCTWHPNCLCSSLLPDECEQVLPHLVPLHPQVVHSSQTILNIQHDI